MALALERWNLHLRMALAILSRVGTRPAALVGGFMLATAFLSLWVSNTATTVMMLPIGLSVIALLQARGAEDTQGGGFPTALLLGIAYAASVGGLGTLIGTPPNALLAGFMHRTYGVEVGFAQWMLLGLPLVAILLFCTWVLLTRIAFRLPSEAIAGSAEVIRSEMHPGRGRAELADGRAGLLRASLGGQRGVRRGSHGGDGPTFAAELPARAARQRHGQPPPPSCKSLAACRGGR